MELFGSYSFFTISRESIELLPKNGKLKVFLAVFSAVLSSCFVLLFKYSLQSLVADMFVAAQQSVMSEPFVLDISFTPTTGLMITGQIGHLEDDFVRLLKLQISFVLYVAIISFFSVVSTILHSAMSYSSKPLMLKDLFSSIWTTWTRPLIAILYASRLAIECVVLVVILATPLLMYPICVIFWATIFLRITASIFYLYLSVAWALAVVVSVVEEGCYGMEALGKPAALAKGKRVQAFLLSVSFNVVVYVILAAYKMILGHKGLINPTMHALFVVSVASFTMIFLVIAYMVLYFHCKGQRIELHGSFFLPVR
ncbi:uncharacterized protein LOC110012001 [Sesamum indicum]|uniref:Uncharacterized protein LOC110012001 n=1 Tax=Sesamum indicum TaxID=4182 RepID=A0A8M8URP6_SESIN|nr:uncharacterized protein LOC110012001 [Sesamum indicum]